MAENARPGTSAWRITRRGPASAIEGFADHTSVRPGQPFRLYVSTTARGFTATAFRVGWYGGRQGRLVWRSGHVVGRRQPRATVSAHLHTVTAPWRPSLAVRTTGWPVGDYLVELTSDRGYRSYVPMTVRSASTRGKVVLLNSVATWEAYNTWDGYDLYTGPHGFADRSRAVSFDRPYDRSGIDRFLAFERPAVVLAERLGLRLAYLTDTDLARQPGVLAGARALITLGHAEYWSLAMRTAVTRARDAGTNIAFLGANAVNRHIRFGSSALGPMRLVICYNSATEDPYARTHPADSTQDWRLPPHPRPESALLGLLYECFPANAPYVVADPGSWLFAGTGVRRGTRFPGLVGPETDRLDLKDPTPRPLEVLAVSTFSCGGRPTWADSAYYTTRSGAGVVDVGTMRWVPALGHSHRVSPAAWRFVTRVTTTLLRAFAAGPCGRAHPAHDDARRYAHGR
ncbi:MAG: hypothetical protein J2P24_20540 [Streptosporangiales bacterium]|nr:hypothetical protein [Streptosporangiales bacterium]